jgi:hypothetical protein
MVRGFAGKDEIVGGELLVIKNRRTVLHEAVGLSDRANKRPLEPDSTHTYQVEKIETRLKLRRDPFTIE